MSRHHVAAGPVLMDDGYTALRTPRGPRAPARGVKPARGLAVGSRYRRRRAGALAVVAGIALLLGMITGAGSGGSGAGNPAAAHRTGFFTRIHTLAGNGAGSFAAAQSTAENAAITRTLAYTPYVRIAGSQHRE